MTGLLTVFDPRSSELNRGPYRLKKYKKTKTMGNILGGEKFCLEYYIEIIFSAIRHSLCLQRDGLSDKI